MRAEEGRRRRSARQKDAEKATRPWGRVGVGFLRAHSSLSQPQPPHPHTSVSLPPPPSPSPSLSSLPLLSDLVIRRRRDEGTRPSAAIVHAALHATSTGNQNRPRGRHHHSAEAMLCHIIIPTTSHHHSYYVTSSYTTTLQKPCPSVKRDLPTCQKRTTHMPKKTYSHYSVYLLTLSVDPRTPSVDIVWT